MTPRQHAVIFPTIEKVKALLQRERDETSAYIVTVLWKQIRVRWIYQKQGAIIAAIAIIRGISVKEVFESIPYAEEDAILAACDFRDHYEKNNPQAKQFESFEQTIDGWVVMTPKHPETKKPMVSWPSFRTKRTDCIKAFIDDGLFQWEDWKKAYGFRCVRASSTIRLSDSVENHKRMGL